MGERLVHVHFVCSEELRRRLKVAAATSGVTMTSVIVEAVEGHLARIEEDGADVRRS